MASSQHNESTIRDGSGDGTSDSGLLTGEQIVLARRARVVKALPNEILDNIFACFDSPAPSDSRLYDEPVFDLTSSNTAHLKSSSMVCWRWRRAVLPRLFKYMCLILRDPVMPNPVRRSQYFALADFVRRNNLKSAVVSFTVCVRNVGLLPPLKDWIELKTKDSSPFWAKIFEVMDPLDVKIVAPPVVLGYLTGCNVRSQDYEYFQTPYHYLHLGLPTAPLASASPNTAEKGEETEQRAPIRSSTLFESRPWNSLLLNEGSFVQAYKRHDFHEKDPPSILDDLMGDNEKGISTAMIPATVRDLSYVAMFPTSTHFHKVTRNCPRLNRLYTQFVPRNDILKDQQLMLYVDPNDMWLERNSCYAYIMRELFTSPPTGNFRYLREFDSGDAADLDAWEMAVEYVKRAGGGWRVERPGVFVKDTELAEKQKNMINPEFVEGQVPSLLSVPSDNYAIGKKFS